MALLTVAALMAAAVVVTVADNFSPLSGALPPELFKAVSHTVENAGWKYGWRSNKGMGYAHWNHDFGGGTPENGLDVSAALSGPIADAWNHLRPANSVLLRCYANAHTYGCEGYPHTDSSRPIDQTIVLYTVRQWRREWGGETVLYDGDRIVHSELPKPNGGVIFPGAMLHAARGVSRICPDLRTTLMFKFCPANADPLRDRIQRLLEEINAHRTPHSGRTLALHLLNVFDLLRNARQPDAVCAAGAVHSVWGTEHFKGGVLDPSDFDRVASVVGFEAAELARLFGIIRRPEALEIAGTELPLHAGGTVSVTQQQLDRLRIIDAENMADQGTLCRFPNLERLWNLMTK